MRSRLSAKAPNTLRRFTTMANATSLSKDEILDAIGNMTVLELSELVDAFKTKFNVTIAAAPVGAAPAAGGAGGAAAPVAEEQTEFTVNLKEAKDLVDGAPQAVKTGVTKEEAATMKAKLEDQGAVVEVK